MDQILALSFESNHLMSPRGDETGNVPGHGGKEMTTIKKKKVDILVNFKIDYGLLAMLDSLANKKGWSRSLVIRQAIREYIKKRAT